MFKTQRTHLEKKVRLALCALLLLLQPAVTTPPAGAMGSRPDGRFSSVPHANPGPEALLVNTLDAIRHNRLDEALSTVDRLLALRPDFKLANLIRGDLLLARARPLAAFGGGDTSSGQVSDLRQEALARLKRYQDEPPAGRVPENLLQMLPEQNYAVVVDASASRLYLFQNVNGLPHYVADYYVTIGRNGVGKNKEGDKLSPMGVYFVTSWLPKDKLSDFYGPIAFPLSYPNEWDKRMGRDGHGIWLHGTPSDTYSRPPRASDGCVVLTNPDITAISRSMQPGLTPVVISDTINWVEPLALEKERNALTEQLEAWRKAWESRDNRRYIGFYASDFAADGQNRSQWEKQKEQVNASKTWIEIKLGRVSLFRYPGKAPMAVVTFDQEYRSNNLNNTMRKRQYWKQENGAWKIVYEGAA